MALLLPGRSKCPIFHEIIASREEAYLFPPIFGPAHAAAVLNDAPAHRWCVDGADFGPEAVSEAVAFVQARRKG
jgi:hypothetical protein